LAQNGDRRGFRGFVAEKPRFVQNYKVEDHLTIKGSGVGVSNGTPK
jgi:hypothetical protein